MRKRDHECEKEDGELFWEIWSEESIGLNDIIML